MSETAAKASPTLTAVAARAFMDRIDNPVYLRLIETRAVNGGWAGARGAGCWDTHVSDAISKAAIDYVLDLFRLWAAEGDGEVTASDADAPRALREEITRQILAQKARCPVHPSWLPKPSCWTCARNGAFQRAARIALGKFPAAAVDDRN